MTFMHLFKKIVSLDKWSYFGHSPCALATINIRRLVTDVFSSFKERIGQYSTVFGPLNVEVAACQLS